VSYTNLHNHSTYSLLDGLSSVPDIVRLSKEFGCPAVAITDHGNLHAIPEFYEAAKKFGQKPIFGSEFYIAPEPGIKQNYYHLVLLAKNIAGYRNLCRLTTLSNTATFPDGRDSVVSVFGRFVPRLCWEWVEQYKEGLICSSACVSSELSQKAITFHAAPTQENLRSYTKVLERFKHLFGDDYYAETMHDDMGGDIGDKQRIANEMARQWAPAYGIKIVGTCDSHFLVPEDRRNHQTLLDLSAHQKFYDPEDLKRMVYKGRFWFKNPDEFAAEFGEEVAANTREIAAKVESFSPYVKKFVLPSVATPLGRTSDAGAAYSVLEASAIYKYAEYAMSGRIPLGGELGVKYRERLDYELSVFKKMELSQYPLALLEIVNHARSVDIPVGPGRGSVSGSLLCYVLGLHQVDPIKYGLYFERFLNPDRVSMPDIDTDFGIFGRPAVIDFIRKNWGPEYVSLICTFNTYGLKKSIHELCKIMDLPYSMGDVLTKAIPEDDIEVTWDSACADYPEFVNGLKALTPQVRADMEAAAKAIYGKPSNLGLHAAGVLISSNPISDVAPLIRAKDGVAVQYSFEHCENFGLLKMDILGNRNLDVIYQTCKKVGIADPTTIPLDDAKTYDLLCQGRLAGIFQIEKSRQFKEVCIRLKPRIFDEVVDLVALYRPGPIENGDLERYVRRKTEPNFELDDTIADTTYRSILEGTKNCLIYQEQIMEVAKQLAGYSMSKADDLRKAIGKKDKDKMASHEGPLKAGLIAYGFNEADAEKIWGMIVTSGRYSWNKAHAVAYGMITYWTAYLSANYPSVYFSSYCNCDIDQNKQRTYIGEAKSRGAKVSGPDVNRSGRDYTYSDGVIYYGLASVRSAGDIAVNAILTEREARGPFTSLSDFRRRIAPKSCNKAVVMNLAKAGAFDSIFSMERRRDLCKLIEDESYDMIPQEAPIDQSWILEVEGDALGVAVSFDPLAPYMAEVKSEGAVGVNDALAKGQTYVKIAGVLAGLKKTVTRKKDPMAFGSLIDMSGEILDIVIFPKAYAKCAEWIGINKPVVIYGELEDKQGMGSGTSNLKVETITRLGTRMPHTVQFHITDTFQAIWYNGLPRVKQEGYVDAKATFEDQNLADFVPESRRYAPVATSYPNFAPEQFKHLY